MQAQPLGFVETIRRIELEGVLSVDQSYGAQVPRRRES
jgi:hypothetical protein